MRLLSIVVTVALFAATLEAAAVHTASATATAPKQTQQERKTLAKEKTTKAGGQLDLNRSHVSFSSLPFEERAQYWQYAAHQMVSNLSSEDAKTKTNSDAAFATGIPARYRRGRRLEHLRDGYLVAKQRGLTDDQYRQALSVHLGVQWDPVTGRLTDATDTSTRAATTKATNKTANNKKKSLNDK